MRHNEAIGLDIGAHSAKVVVMRRFGGTLALRAADWVRLPAGREQAGRVLEAFIKKHGWSDLPCIVPVRGEGVMLQDIELAADDSRKLHEVVRHEMAAFKRLSDSGTVSDYAPQKRINKRRHVFLCVGRLDEILAEIDFFRDAGVQVIDVTPSMLAFFNAVSHFVRPRRSETVAVIDIGHERTQVVVGRRKTVLFARGFPLGAGSFRVGKESADEAVGEQGGDPESWVSELQTCLEVYTSRFPQEALKPGRVILGGGGALTPGVKERVAKALDVKTILLSEEADSEAPDEPERFACAFGLAMQGLNRGQIRLSLLPRPMKEALVLQWQKRFWIMTGLCLVAAIALLMGAAGVRVKNARETLASLDAEMSRMEDLKGRVDSFKGVNERLEMQIMPFMRAVHNGQVLTAVLHAVGEAKHPDDWITLIADRHAYISEEISLEREETEGRVPGERRTVAVAPEISRVVIEGYTPVHDLSTVRKMIDTLRRSPGIADADLLGDDVVREDLERDERWAMTECRLFAVEISVPTP